MAIKRSNHLPNISDLFSYGRGKDFGNEGKNFAFDNCMEFVMEKLGENKKLDYWVMTGITGNGYTPVYHKNDAAAACEYCVSGYFAGPDYVGDVFNAIGYGHTYVTAKQLNADKPKYIQKLMDHVGRGIPVIVIDRSTVPLFADALTHYLYVGQEDYERTFLFSKKAGDALYHELNSMDFIPQDWIFAEEKQRDIALADIYRNAVAKIPYWLTLQEQDGVFFGAAAYCAWADEIEAGRYDSEIDAWHNYRVYVCNLATIAWANNVKDAPYATIVNRLAQIDARYVDMNTQIAEQYTRLGDEGGSSGWCKNGIWKELEELGGGLNNYSRDALSDKANRARIAAKFREAANCIDEIVRCFV